MCSGAERTWRWLEQLEVPLLSEAELRRPVSFGAAAAAGARHNSRPAKPGSPAIPGVPHKDRAEPGTQRRQHRAKHTGLFSCLMCTSTLD